MDFKIYDVTALTSDADADKTETYHLRRMIKEDVGDNGYDSTIKTCRALTIWKSFAGGGRVQVLYGFMKYYKSLHYPIFAMQCINAKAMPKTEWVMMSSLDVQSWLFSRKLLKEFKDQNRLLFNILFTDDTFYHTVSEIEEAIKEQQVALTLRSENRDK